MEAMLQQGHAPRLTGGCFCGRVRYEAAGPAFHGTVCHCASCRRMVGAASVAWVSVERAGFRFTAEPPTSFQSSPHVTRTFCPTCGTSLTYASDGHGAEIDITIASLDDPDAVPPGDYVQAREKLRWTTLGDDLPVHDGSRPA